MLLTNSTVISAPREVQFTALAESFAWFVPSATMNPDPGCQAGHLWLSNGAWSSLQVWLKDWAVLAGAEDTAGGAAAVPQHLLLTC